MDLQVSISGMHCPACIDSVTETIKRLRGVQIRDVSIGILSVSMDGSIVSKNDVFQAIRSAGTFDIVSFTET